MDKKIELKTDSLIRRVSAIGKSKREAFDRIRSKGTLRSYRQCLKQYLIWRQDLELPYDTQDSVMDLTNYLQQLSEWVVQSTLDQHRMALSRVFHKKLPKVQAYRLTDIRKRCYLASEVQEIVNSLSEPYGISTLLCFYSGLRVHEIGTLRRSDEIERSISRKWRDDLFIHMQNYQIYLVIGKGGLKRFVAVPNALVGLIEKYRLPQHKVIKDRAIEYIVYYDLPFGQRLSQQFSKQSREILRRKSGGGVHGLRHSYAQNRLRTLIHHGINFNIARAIVSQEMGHFRPQITNTYLR